MTIQTINIGAAPNDDTGDDPRTAGQKLNNNFTTSTHAASRGVGIATGQVPDADDLNMVGATENYTSNNLNPNVFGATDSFIAVGTARTTTVVRFELPISMINNPSSITVVGSFSIFNASWSSVDTGLTGVTLHPSSSNKLAMIEVVGTGFIVGDSYKLFAQLSGNKITVNP